ncbi:MAG TPA: MAPEG family protein [Bacteriovoracaceae bacterium]|nr:MAPEG family protein [Bacteriovoracaceae bacterium]
MKFEYQALAVMSLFFLFAFLPVSLGKLQSFGGKWLASNRDRAAGPELVAWAARCERAHANLKDNFPAFAVAILLLGALEKFDGTTEIAAGLYLAGRVIHFISYGLGNVRVRFLSFVLALVANVVLLWKCFG